MRLTLEFNEDHDPTVLSELATVALAQALAAPLFTGVVMLTLEGPSMTFEVES